MVAVRVMQLMDFQHLLRGESVVRPYRACAYHQLAGGFDLFFGFSQFFTHILGNHYTCQIRCKNSAARGVAAI